MRRSWWLILPIVLVAIYLGINLYAKRRVQKEVDNAIAEMSSFADVQYEDVDFNLFTHKTSVKGVVISPVGEERKLFIDEIVVFKAEEGRKIFTRLHMAFKGIRVEGQEGRVTELLEELGYEPEETRADVELDYKFDPEGKDFYLRTLSYRVRGMGEMSLSLHLSNVDLESGALSLLLSFPQILIHEARLSYRDDSLVPRLLKVTAEKRGISVEGLIEEITAEIEREVSRTEDRITSEALTAFKEFLEDPKEISVIISPRRPVPLGKLKRAKDPAQLMKTLNLRVKS